MRSPVTVTIDDHNVTATVKPLDTLYKVVAVSKVYARIQDGLTALGPEWEPFVQLEAVVIFAGLIMGGSEITGIDMPSPSDGPEVLAEAFCRYAHLDTDILTAIREAYDTASMSDNERKFLPKEALSDEERNFTQKSEGTSG